MADCAVQKKKNIIIVFFFFLDFAYAQMDDDGYSFFPPSTISLLKIYIPIFFFFAPYYYSRVNLEAVEGLEQKGNFLPSQ
jgi:hypothetical protein